MIKEQNVPELNEKSAQFFWTMFILMFFVIQAIIWTFAIAVTAGDKSHAVVAGYDEQALTWDEAKDAKLRSDRLGWNVSFFVDPSQDIRGNRILTLQLTGKTNEPIKEAQLNMESFHRAAASERQSLDFEEVGHGIYTSTMKTQRVGKWCFSGSATVGEQRFLIDETIKISDSNTGGD